MNLLFIIILTLTQFIALVTNGSGGIRGVYVPGEFALPVVQQPRGAAGWVSPEDNTLTQFRMAANYGVTAFLAHNYFSGSEFYDLDIGNWVIVVRGDRSVEIYRVVMIRGYRADPPLGGGRYIDLVTGESFSERQLFNKYYVGNHLIFQTCITEGNLDTWGRLFIVAERRF